MKTTLKRLNKIVVGLAALLALGACDGGGGKDDPVNPDEPVTPVNPDEPVDPGTHTYNGAFSLSPTTFNPLQYKSTTDSVPLDYTTDGLYGYTYNATGDGFEIAPVMAAADPVDVTTDYARQFNLTNLVSVEDYFKAQQVNRVVPSDEDLNNSNYWDAVDEETYNAFCDFVGPENAKDWADDSAADLYDEWYIFKGFKVYATENQAFRIQLNPDCCWEDGTKITADDYIYTMQQCLDPLMNNYRASDYYNGAVVIANAKNYFYSGREVMVSDEAVYSKNTNDLYFDIDGDNFFGFTPTYGGNLQGFYDYFAETYKEWAAEAWASEDLTYDGSFPTAGAKTDYADYAAYEAAFVEYKMLGAGASAARLHIANLKKYCDEHAIVSTGATNGTVKWNDEVEELIGNVIFDVYGGYQEYAIEFACYIGSYPVTEWDKVGLKKIDANTLDIVYTGPIVGFYQKYSIGLPLVNKTLYEKCKKVDPVTGALSSTYATSVDTYIGYGPYKLTKYIVDQQMVFERNPNWFGYQDKYADKYGTFVAEFDGKTHKQYETDKVVLTYAKEMSTREEMFIKGQLDGLGLDAALYSKYSKSSRLYATTGASTFCGVLMSDYDILVQKEAVANNVTYDASYDGSKQAINKTILSIKEFRQALCYALDRSTLVATLSPGSTPAISLFSDLIIADPEHGKPFNSFDDTKKAICDFWSVNYTDANLDSQYSKITGWDLTTARNYLEQAVTKAKAQGLMGANTRVELEYNAANDNETEQKWFQVINNCLVDLAKGTSLEGKLSLKFNANLGSGFGDSIRAGLAETAWGFGWSGGELDPYDLWQVYIDAGDPDGGDYQYDPWINRNTDEYNVSITADFDGKGEKTLTYNVFEWWLILNGDTRAPQALDFSYQKVEDAVRAKILAACENRVLQDFSYIPMMNEGSVQLLTYKLNYGKEEYLFGLGFGGIRYITYNYTDMQWDAYVKGQTGGKLTY